MPSEQEEEVPEFEELHALARALVLSWVVWFVTSVLFTVVNTAAWAIVSGENNLPRAAENGPWWVQWPVMSLLAAFAVLMVVFLFTLLLDLVPAAYRDLSEFAADMVSGLRKLLRMTVGAWKEVYREYVR